MYDDSAPSIAEIEELAMLTGVPFTAIETFIVSAVELHFAVSDRDALNQANLTLSARKLAEDHFKAIQDLDTVLDRTIEDQRDSSYQGRHRAS